MNDPAIGIIIAISIILFGLVIYTVLEREIFILGEKVFHKNTNLNKN